MEFNTIKIIAETIGALAAIFRIWSLFCKTPEKIKLLVTIGNALFMISGFVIFSPSLIISNGACLIAYVIQYFKNKKLSEKS